MKKIKLLLLSIVLIMTISVVKAESIFEKGWTDTSVDFEQYDCFNTINAYEEGYMSLNITNSGYGTHLVLYDLAGNINKEKIIKNYDIVSGVYYKEYFYFVAVTSSSEYILKYDKNLKKVQEYEDSIIEKIHDFFGNTTYNQEFKAFSIKDERLYFLSYLDGEEVIASLDLDLTDLNIEDFSEEYFEEEVKLSELLTEQIRLYDTNKNRTALISGENCGRIAGGGCSQYLVIVENDEITFEKKLSRYKEYNSVKILNDYILIDSFDEDNELVEIFVYNFKGVLVDTITIEDSYSPNLAVNNNSFVIGLYNNECGIHGGAPSFDGGGTSIPTYKSSKDSKVIPPVYKGGPSSSQCELSYQEYHLPLLIETKVNGEGTIDVVKTSVYGEEVKFTITPASGYTLGTVKVYDKEGNELVFTSNTFTMPNRDVTIEVTFVSSVLNPNTKDIALIAIVLTSIIGAIVTYNNYRRLKWLN